MRELRYSVAQSLDGCIAGANDEFDWIPMDPDIDFVAMYAGFSGLVMGRRSYEVFQATGGAPGPALPVPDRWRLLETLNLLPERWYDPYRQNTLKGDKPVLGKDGFVALTFVSDTVYEPRRLPTPVG